MKMNKYAVFFENYKQAQSKDAQMTLLKDFLFSLSPDELMAWLKDSNQIIKDNLSQLIHSGDVESLQYAKDCINEMEAFLNPKLVRKAA
jgi:hypothetical protein